MWEKYPGAFPGAFKYESDGYVPSEERKQGTFSVRSRRKN